MWNISADARDKFTTMVAPLAIAPVPVKQPWLTVSKNTNKVKKNVKRVYVYYVLWNSQTHWPLTSGKQIIHTQLTKQKNQIYFQFEEQ